MSIDLPKEDLHHAYIVTGDREQNLSRLNDFLREELDVATSQNPDYFFMEEEVLGVDIARGLRKKQERKAFSENRKIFVVACEEITREAQNSLLKIFEEPTPGTHFFVILPSTEKLLPTLISRVEITTDREENTQKDADISAQTFLAADIAERLEMLSDIVDEKDARRARRFLDAVEQELHQHLEVKEGIEWYDDLYKVKEYLSDRGSSIKTLLQHTALVLPKL